MNDGAATREQMLTAVAELRAALGEGWGVFSMRPHPAYRVLPDGSWARLPDDRKLVVDGWVASARAPGGRLVSSTARETIAEVADDLRQAARRQDRGQAGPRAGSGR